MDKWYLKDEFTYDLMFYYKFQQFEICAACY